MSFIELFLIAAGLSADAFAVAVCAGLSMKKADLKSALTVGLYFGVFQAAMPVAGYFAATWFADKIAAYGHWIAFALLSFLGVKMIAGSFDKDGRNEVSVKFSRMLPLAVATSIDALAVGVSFAFLRVNVAPAALLIGVTTLALSVAGVKIGNVFGMRFKSKAEFAGGVILAGIGVKVLIEGLI